MVSKAFEKSRNIAQVFLFSSIAVFKFSIVSRIAYSVECPFLKPNR
jgi:hypothetical protein